MLERFSRFVLIPVTALLFTSIAAYAQSAERQKAVLAPGESVQIPAANAKVTFEELVEDSRCPIGINCIWAGDAAVRLSVSTSNAEPASYTLHANPELLHEIEIAGSRIVLSDVKPRPTADRTPRRDEYRITLLIGRKGP